MLKVRVYGSLRQTSTALTCIAIVNILLGMLDLEIYYCSLGELIPPGRPASFGQECEYSWHKIGIDPDPGDGSGGTTGGNETDYMSEVPTLLLHCGYTIKTLITILSCVSVLLVWWYTELERRLLVIRHHLCGEINLLFTPLARNRNKKI